MIRSRRRTATPGGATGREERRAGVSLVRGNAQVRDGDQNNPPAQQSSSSSALSALGL